MEMCSNDVFMTRHACHKLLIILVALLIWVSITHYQWARLLTPDYINTKTKTNIYSLVGLVMNKLCLIWSGPEPLCNI